MILYLEKRGCDFFDRDGGKTAGSDLENYRLALEFIDREGVRVCGDITMCDVREWRRKKSGKEECKIVSTIGLHTNFQYENWQGCYSYEVDTRGFRYTQADALKLINSVSAVQYEAVSIVDILPEAAREYPPEVAAMADAREAREHAALMEDAMRRARSDWTRLVRTTDHAVQFMKVTPDEYKRLCIATLEGIRDKFGIITQKGAYAVAGIGAAHHVTKKIFEEQGIFNPHDDQEFINTILPLCPYYVARYLDVFTLDQFAVTYAQG